MAGTGSRNPARPERPFLGIAIPGPVQEAIRAALPDTLPGRAVRTELLHITLRFMGDTAPAAREDLLRRLRDAALRGELGARFVLHLGGLGAYPSTSRARVLWLGTRAGEPIFDRLATAVERVAVSAGLGAAQRAPASHVTLSRLEPPRAVRELAAHSVEIAQPLDVNAVTLFRSDLSPAGPRYTTLATIELPAPR